MARHTVSAVSAVPPRALTRTLNLGPKSAAALARIGITTLTQLRQAGAVPTYVQLKRIQSGISLNMLYALVGALEGLDWQFVKRDRKLALVMQVEDFERQHSASKAASDELLALRNIGPAMRRDFTLLGITSIKQLARCNPDKLYARIQTLTNARHDPCVWDTYAAAIHQAKTGEALPWWHFTRIRKHRHGLSARPQKNRT